MEQKSYRLMQKFWLDVTKDTEYELASKITELKKQRSFTSVVRDGLRLICDLREGRIDVLRELFPFVFDMVATVLETERAQIEQERLKLEAERLRHENSITSQLQRMEAILLQQGNVPIVVPTPAPAPAPIGGPKMLTMNKAVTPTFDDDDDETLDICKSTSTAGVDNFFRTLSLLQ